MKNSLQETSLKTWGLLELNDPRGSSQSETTSLRGLDKRNLKQSRGLIREHLLPGHPEHIQKVRQPVFVCPCSFAGFLPLQTKSSTEVGQAQDL